MPEGRTHMASSRTGTRRRRSFCSSAVSILSGGPSGSSANLSGRIRTQSTVMSGAKSFHRQVVFLWMAPSWEIIRGT